MSRSVADLAFLSDSRSCAVVDREGEVCWWPGPRFDGPSPFTSLLDPDAGRFRIAPAGGVERCERHYLDGTLVLRSDLRGPGGALRLTDALALRPGAVGHELGMDPMDALVRTVEALDGDVEVEVAFVPRPEYGLAVPQVRRAAGVLETVGGPERLFLVDGGRLDVDGAKATGRFTLRAGETAGFVVRRVPAIDADPPAPLDAAAVLASTVGTWRSWSAMHQEDGIPHAGQVAFAARVLQGLTHQPTGAVVAAGTTSLPELPGGDANWDYRYAWLRDSAFIARALLDATCADEAVRWFDWICKAATSCHEAAHVQIVFGLGGERQLDERELDHLEGFGGARPVRVGNAAWRQQQLDVLGEVLDVALQLRDHDLLDLDDFTQDFLCQLVDRAAEQWREPDAGMWEARAGDEHHTASKVMCWVALDRGVRLARELGTHADAEHWAAVADEVRGTVLREAWNDDLQAFAGTLGGDQLDVAVLVLPSFGFLEATDPRMRSTVAAIEERLGRDGLLVRSERRREEPAFLPASFWLAAAHAWAGDVERAEAVFARATACANDLGLLAEMADLETGEPLGNVPQALTHVGLVRAAHAIGEARERTTETPKQEVAA
ncbi:glycoside hydrolase family 15 protein [Conexibacter sp. SYSU D00693]|uniref:glycoside hydrolase family 15 protein n=1 Tax=Conexibacter sp. SYSU D00693 TaxID=2812560 RepID=UPI00196B361D|nr:glycoside hydrolase family 15 protein [Conexibacter sp. SYSU D00693]